MEKLILFSLIVSWPVCIWNTLVAIATIHNANEYEGSLEESFHALSGYTMKFKPKKFIIWALVSGAWIITNAII